MVTPALAEVLFVESAADLRRWFEANHGTAPEQWIGVYAYDAESVDFPPDLEARFRADERAWQFFSQQPPGYRRSMTWWVVSAKRDETRARRLAALISESAAARRVDQLNLPKLGAAAGSSR